MAEINAQMVKQLRQRTGAGIMDCKNALAEANGDEEKAVEIIQKKGLAKVVKKAGAIAAEGMIFAYIHPGSRLGVLVEVNCETDFVARNEEFKAFVEHVAMQIASMTPQFVRREDIAEADKNDQLKLYKEQMVEEGLKTGSKKPPQVIDKIVAGKLEKWMSDSCLLEQVSVIENEKTIGQLSDGLSAKLGEKIIVRRFSRYELGEGIERKKSDLAAEVASSLVQS
jgi:elongation factor Ts